jgi:hypothetical protein
LASADEETDEGADDEVEERPHRPIVPGLSERESGFPTPTGSRFLSRPSKWSFKGSTVMGLLEGGLSRPRQEAVARILPRPDRFCQPTRIDG